jgi:hypothetical protein
MFAEQEARNSFGSRTHCVIIKMAHYRNMDMQSGAAGSFDERAELKFIQGFFESQRNFASLFKGFSIQLRFSAFGLFAGVDIRIDIKDNKIGYRPKSRFYLMS